MKYDELIEIIKAGHPEKYYFNTMMSGIKAEGVNEIVETFIISFNNKAQEFRLDIGSRAELYDKEANQERFIKELIAFLLNTHTYKDIR